MSVSARTRGRRRSSSAPTWSSKAWTGFARRAGGAGRGVRFRDLLRVSVLLFGGTATALAVVSVVGAAQEDTNTLVYVAAVWWCVASLAGFWLGRRPMTTPGIATLLGEARTRTRCPSWSPAP